MVVALLQYSTIPFPPNTKYTPNKQWIKLILNTTSTFPTKNDETLYEADIGHDRLTPIEI